MDSPYSSGIALPTPQLKAASMRPIATVVLSLAGLGFVSASHADDFGIRPAMLNSNLSAASATTGMTGSSDALTAQSDVPAMVLAPRQAMSSSMPASFGDAAESRRLGAANAKADLATEAQMVSNAYHAERWGGYAAGSADQADTAAVALVPNSWQLSITPNAARDSLIGLNPADRPLTK
jgi:hypothetical protein